MTSYIDSYIRNLPEPKLTIEAQYDATPDELALDNLRFVVKLAHQFKDNGATLDELISAGNMGLMEASKKFDAKQGVKFISFAVHTIKMYMRQAGQAKETIRITSAQRIKLGKIKQAISDFKAAHFGEPDTKEIAELTGMSVFAVESALRHSATGTISTETTIGAEDSLTLGDSLVSEWADPSETYENNERYDVMKEALTTLSERDQLIVDLRYSKGKTLKEIAKIVGLTSSGVNAVQKKINSKIRAYMDNNQ